MLHWTCKPFNELTLSELYALLRLRSEVFVVEQACVFLDMDNQDQAAHHLLGTSEDHLVAYTRIIAPGQIYAEASIGRVVTAPTARRTGAGRALMEQSIDAVYRLYGPRPIRIGAQLYLQAFYRSFGFEPVSEVYIEDGIPHLYMLRPAA